MFHPQIAKTNKKLFRILFTHISFQFFGVVNNECVRERRKRNYEKAFTRSFFLQTYPHTIKTKRFYTLNSVLCERT